MTLTEHYHSDRYLLARRIISKKGTIIKPIDSARFIHELLGFGVV